MVHITVIGDRGSHTSFLCWPAGAEGPTHWPGACTSGTQQSPINLTLNQVNCDGRGAPDIRCAGRFGTSCMVVHV